MTRLLFICSLAAALQSVYCQQPTTLTDSQRAAIKDSVTQMINRYCDEMRAKHLEATLECFDDSPGSFWVLTPDSTVISYDTLAAFLKPQFQLYRSIDVVLTYMRVEPLTNQYAVYTGRYHVTDIDTSGKVLNNTGVMTGIAVHRPSGWKYLNGQTYEVPLKGE